MKGLRHGAVLGRRRGHISQQENGSFLYVTLRRRILEVTTRPRSRRHAIDRGTRSPAATSPGIRPAPGLDPGARRPPAHPVTADHVLIDGHERWKAIQELGLTKYPLRVVGNLSDAERKELANPAQRRTAAPLQG